MSSETTHVNCFMEYDVKDCIAYLKSNIFSILSLLYNLNVESSISSKQIKAQFRLEVFNIQEERIFIIFIE